MGSELYLGVDVGGTNITTALVRESGGHDFAHAAVA